MPSQVGCAIKVQVLRSSVRSELDLIPQRWAGRGLLGCHMAPKL